MRSRSLEISSANLSKSSTTTPSFLLLDFSQNGNSTTQDPDIYKRYFWCRDHKLAISSEILPKLYRAVRDAFTNARTAPDTSTTDLMSHSKALLILCPDSLTSWNSRKIILSLNYDYSMLEDELKLCALILSYLPKNESTWSHRYVNLAHCLLQEMGYKKGYRTTSGYFRDYREGIWTGQTDSRENTLVVCLQSLLRALLECNLENGDDSFSMDSETCLLWKEELRWDEMLIRRYQGRESLWIHRRFLSQWWIQQSLGFEETSSISPVDTFVVQEINLLWECINAPSDEFEESRVQEELAALYILWISKQVPAVKEKLEERICFMSMGRLEDVLGRACRPEKKRLWMSLLGLDVNSRSLGVTT
ncbi:hypothetical protein PR202_ga29375 [Eleusine coracana subsp. coracana]|uniref:Uncharacterized protein n=1 Tax=Eleusine coracana subsp. coracana TaxID=191504 RepID=A0AAV5DM70_ELECO|nr:hypothetical protein PR202_ga29375 [Eleusine coracana subsp. coracana]